MPGANFIFHLTSLILILFLLYKVIGWRKENNFLKSLIFSQCHWRPGKIEVEWSHIFLEKLCYILDIPYSLEGSIGSNTKPSKLKKNGIVQLFLKYSISQIVYKAEGGQSEVVFFLDEKSPDKLELDILKDKLVIELGISKVRYIAK